MGPCMCGDPACGSCGPAQGYCPRCVMADKDECDCESDHDDNEPDHDQREDWIKDRDSRSDAGTIFDDED